MSATPAALPRPSAAPSPFARPDWSAPWAGSFFIRGLIKAGVTVLFVTSLPVLPGPLDAQPDGR